MVRVAISIFSGCDGTRIVCGNVVYEIHEDVFSLSFSFYNTAVAFNLLLFLDNSRRCGSL